MESAIKIVSLDFYRVGKFDQQHRRSFNLRDDVLEDIVKASQVLAQDRYADPELVVPLFGERIKISPLVEPVQLPTSAGNSWNDEVASFVMQLENTRLSGEVMKVYVAGYTDRLPEENGLLDLDMRFTINSVFYIKENLGVAGGPPHYRVIAHQVLHDPYVTVFSPDKHTVRMRPSEVASSMGVLTLKSQGYDGEVYDTRSGNNYYPAFGAYATIDPSIWFQTMLDGWIQTQHHLSSESFSSHHGVDDVLHMLQRELSNGVVHQDAFMRQLAQVTNGRRSANFTLDELMKIGTVDWKIHEVDNLLQNGDVNQSIDHHHPDAVAADHVIQSVPAIMAKYGIRKLAFHANNLTGDTAMSDITFTPMASGQYAGDEVSTFAHGLRVRVFDVISKNNMEPYVFSGEFDLFAASHMSLDMGNRGTRVYRSPTFANAVFTPLIASSQKRLEEAGQVMLNLFDKLPSKVIFSQLKPTEDDITSLNPWGGCTTGLFGGRKQMFGNNLPDLDSMPETDMTADQLDEKYNPDGDGEHPYFPRATWRDEVFNQLTLVGYWDWVVYQISDNSDDKPFGPG